MGFDSTEVSQKKMEGLMTPIRIGITCGDVGGIGLECFLKALEQIPEKCELLLYAQPEHVRATAETLDGQAQRRGFELAERRHIEGVRLLPLDDITREQPILGQWNELWADIAWHSLEKGAREASIGAIDGVLTLPITKRIVQRPTEQFPGQTEFFAQRWGSQSYAMMLAAPEMRVVPVTTHIPLAEVPKMLTKERIIACIELTWATLRERFGIPEPTLAVCGLNPHAGEEGRLGMEEIEIIQPAIAACTHLRGQILGPLAADTLFPKQKEMGVDAVIAMYHDQGLIPLKTLYFDTGVNTTIGLNGIRTSPDHGVAYPLAGKNQASPSSTVYALRMAVEHAYFQAQNGV